MWTQGEPWLGTFRPIKSGKPGYANWENATDSDAKKVHKINPNVPVFGYYGFWGCCSGRTEWWADDYCSAKSSHLWLRDDSGDVVMTDSDNFVGMRPMWNLCSSDMIEYIKSHVLASYIDSADVSGLFFDGKCSRSLCVFFRS